MIQEDQAFQRIAQWRIGGAEIDADFAGGAVRVTVADTGIGIGPKDISRVMTPFGQVDSALSRKYEGTGLGLPLSKKFIESMGGSFAIESELNVGTSVTIGIPKAPPNWDVSTMTSFEEKTDVAPDRSERNALA